MARVRPPKKAPKKSSPAAPPRKPRAQAAPAAAADSPAGVTRTVGHPVFAQPQPTADPGTFRVGHPSDTATYKLIDELNREHKIVPLPFPAPRGGVEPTLSLEDVLGGDAAGVERIRGQGQIVFHATGDCGSTRGPSTQSEVADKMVSDFQEADPREVPRFALLLGDIVYNFGESQHYYDQFYEPYRDYPAPILAVAGNHDGMIAPEAHAQSLEAYLRNFCADSFVVTPEAGGLSRTAQIQPGVFFTFEAPFCRILVLYSNTLEDPGVISGDRIGDSQIAFLRAALGRVKSERYPGALLIAHHHPAYTASHAGSNHGWSVQMLGQIDAVCDEVGVWPHAVLAGHVHNYQRFTRTRGTTQIPYVSCGNGGHNVMALTRKGAAPLRTPQVLQPAGASTDQVVLESYDDRHYGYLRIVVTSAQLRIEYHAASDGPDVKTPDDSVTVDLASRRLAAPVANDLGHVQAAREVRQQRVAQSRASRRA
jgi:hypothetical protein